MSSPANLAQMFTDTDTANVLTFNEQELHDILGILESRAAGGPNDNIAHAGPRDDSFGGDLDFLAFGQQFQPRSPNGGADQPTPLSSNVSSFENNGSGNLSGYTAPSAVSQQQSVAHIMASVHPDATAASSVPLPTPPITAPHPSMFPGPAPGHLMAPGFPIPGYAMPPISSMVSHALSCRSPKPEKPQISHSTVEKQRRDRINSLIDELRELVPPQKPNALVLPGAKIDSAEARRPKHVVLADTISLLKQWKDKLLLDHQGSCDLDRQLIMCQQQQQVGPLVKEEPTASGSKGSVSNLDDVDMKDDGAVAPMIPHIPMQHTQNAGVTVEKGKDCIFVQVKCRDRRGLLSDIINALKLLPVEIRTAAVTTNGNGMVRDVFEICTDDDNLKPETIQNMVHDALYHQYFVRPEESMMASKRQRGSIDC
mmetsp:Transcript_15304/g.33131  ORF Transcript_15304/g.33131 Transcript_15304/m.33131 type:complete len:426 (-) Transcript_15304:2512-3789(-)